MPADVSSANGRQFLDHAVLADGGLAATLP